MPCPSFFHRVLLTLLVTVICVTSFEGCTRRKDRAELLRGIRLAELRLQPKHTDVNDMSMKAPDGFAVEWTAEAQEDKFYIYDPRDTGSVQQAMIVIDITRAPSKLIPDTAAYERSLGQASGHDVQWRERTIVDDEGTKVHQREMVTADLLADAAAGDARFLMHAFVVGSNETLVERLAASVETITVLPAKPNL